MPEMLDQFPNPVWVFSSSSGFTFFNKKWLQFTGRVNNQERGARWVQGVHKDDLKRCKTIYMQAFRKKEPFKLEYRLRHQSGEFRWVLEFGSPFYNKAGEFSGYIGSCYEIHDFKYEQERLEINTKKLATLNTLKEELIEIVIHDIRNPIANMMNLIELLESEHVSVHGGNSEIFCNVKRQVKNIYNMMENILEWLKSNKDGLVQKPLVLNLSDAVKDTIALLESKAAAKEIGIINKVGNDITVCFDKEVIGLVLRNLLHNAVKFTYRGGLISIDARKNGQETILSLSDSGVGISADRIKAIFEAGSVSPTPGTAGEKGTGLGLLICNELVCQGGGKIWAESVPGKGSTFFVALPAGNML